MDLPRLIVTDTLRRNHLRKVEAYYETLDNTIYLDDHKFFRLTPDIQIFTLVHELGHWLRVNHIDLKDIVGWDPGHRFLIFGAPNSEEGFADSFATYLLDPGELRARYPRQYAAMQGYVAGHRTRLDAWIDDQCRQLGLTGNERLTSRASK